MQRKGQRKKNRPQIQYKNKLKLIKATAKNKTANIDFNIFDDNDNRATLNGSRHEHWDYGKNLTYTNVTKNNKQKQATKDQWKILREFNPPSSTTDIHIPTDGFFCDSPSNCSFQLAFKKLLAYIRHRNITCPSRPIVNSNAIGTITKPGHKISCSNWFFSLMIRISQY